MVVRAEYLLGAKRRYTIIKYYAFAYDEIVVHFRATIDYGNAPVITLPKYDPSRHIYYFHVDTDYADWNFRDE
jgi:hypothetical protein